MTDDAWLAIVRVARDAGDISSLFPEGVTRLIDLPFTIFDLIKTALFFLSFEELPKEERPPKNIWLDGERLEEHWAWVEREREEKTKNPDHVSTQHMKRNALLDELIVGR